jgi:hypothetical protein
VVSGEFDRSLRDLLDIDALIQHHAASDPEFEARLSQRASELGLGDVLLQIQWQRQSRLQAQPKAWPTLSPWARVKAHCLRPLFNAAGGTWHPNRSGAWRGFAQTLLYFRAHALRLPLRLLVPHLLHKLKRRWRAHHAPSEARLEG